MAVAFRAATTATTGTSSASSLNITVSASAVAGDFAIINFEVGNTGTIGATPSGWTALSTFNNTRLDNNQAIYYKTLVSGDVGATVTLLTGGGSFPQGAVCSVYSGAQLDALAVHTTEDNGSASSSITSKPTSYSGNKWIVWCFGVYTGTPGAQTITSNPATSRGIANSGFTVTALSDSNGLIAYASSTSGSLVYTTNSDYCTASFALTAASVDAGTISAAATTAASATAIRVQLGTASAAALTATSDTGIVFLFGTAQATAQSAAVMNAPVPTAAQSAATAVGTLVQVSSAAASSVSASPSIASLAIRAGIAAASIISRVVAAGMNLATYTPVGSNSSIWVPTGKSETFWGRL